MLLHFELQKEFDGLVAKITWIDEDKKYLLPLDLIVSDEGLLRWLKNRAIPANRAYVENFLARLGLNEKDTKGIIDICKGLSLNDSYWTPAASFMGTFAKNNLFENRFSNTLASIAFTGHGSMQPSSFTSSPEFTTHGMLAKCWRKVGGKIMLYKSGTEGAANTGKEPYSEYYAYQVAKAMGIDAIEYGLSIWKGKLCSTCEIFTDIDTSYIPIGRLIREGGIRAVMKFYNNLGEEYYQKLIDMLVFDAVICNTDRHFGNFGVLVDNKTNHIKDFAPIFDNGLSLFCYAMDEDLKNLKTYARTRVPATYPDFVEFAKQIMTKCQRDKLRPLLNIKLKKHQRYNLSGDRLNAIEAFLKDRVRELLK
ncbi:MAG: protein kinase [Peptococcaceae bacterium BRH_c23]|nr:MAG: protein kinase [Peptococcaceae bacterium BRH_c23]KJS89910.1 MAG: protein kinase [Desulfosporosinus sp. BICA1-9]